MDVWKPGCKAQHSRVDLLLRAPRTVTLSVSAEVRAMEARKGARVEMRILRGCLWLNCEFSGIIV